MHSVSIGQMLVLVLMAAIPLVLAIEAIRRARAEDGQMTPGFKGWLFVLAATLWLTPLRAAVEIGRMVNDSGGPGIQFPWLVRADIAISAVTILLSGACLVLMLRRAAAFRSVFPFLAGWLVLNLPISILVARFVLSTVYGVRIGLPEVFAAMTTEIAPWIGGVVAAVAWVIYVRRSRRVAMTFVA